MEHDAGLAHLLAAITDGRDGSADDLRTPIRERLAAPIRTRKLTRRERDTLTSRLGWDLRHLT